MRIVFSVASLLLGLVIVALLAKNQLRALDDPSSRPGSPAAVHQELPRESAGHAGGSTRLPGGGAGGSGALSGAARHAEQAARRAVEQGADRNAAAEPR